MAIIGEFQLTPGEFELGSILSEENITLIEFERLVPTGNGIMPLFWISETSTEPFIESINRHPTVEEACSVDTFENRTLLAIDWDASRDQFVQAINEVKGQIVEAIGMPEQWDFKVRFFTHEDLSTFRALCKKAGISLRVSRIYEPRRYRSEEYFGLTDPQYEALTLAVKRGYYEIPRGCTTQELGEELNISSQAVTERLRRGVGSLATHTLLSPGPE